MTWFKENKFLAGLICITSLLAALLLFFGLNAGTSLKKVQGEIEAKESSLKKMKNLDPYPTIESAKAKEASLVAMLAQANEAREKMQAFRPEAMESVSGKVFSENLSATVAKVKDLFPEEDALPKGFHLGFEGYSGSLPKEEATGVLTYQLGALEYVFQELAAAGVTEVQNLSRVKLPAENGEEWPDAVGSKKSGGAKGKNKSKAKKSKGKSAKGKKGSGKNRRMKPVFEDLPPVAHRLPFEVVFKAPEAQARQFLTKIANSDQYFFETRIGRVWNPSPIPSSGKSSAAAKPKEDGDFDVEGMVIAGAEPSPEDEAEASSEQILNKVSGGDELVIYLRADLLLFIAEQQFPELK